jgi:hypothetical protein
MEAVIRDITGELDVSFSSPEEFGRIALGWLTEGVQALAAGISEEILAGPPLKPYWHEGLIQEEDPRFHPEVPPLWGEIRIVYPSRTGGYGQYAKPYSKTSLRRLEALSGELNKAIVSLQRWAGDGFVIHDLEVHREGRGNGHARPMVTVPAHEDLDASCPEVTFMREYCARHAVAFGHVSARGRGLPGETDLERALNRQTWTSLAEWDRYLRGYSWVTVVPAVLAARLGGVGALRGSGAFAVVNEVAGGSVWLQATRRWSEWAGDQAVVDRVFEVLAPVLPPGMPEPGDPLAPPEPDKPQEIIPYLLSLRDAADFHAGAEK